MEVPYHPGSIVGPLQAVHDVMPWLVSVPSLQLVEHSAEDITALIFSNKTVCLQELVFIQCETRRDLVDQVRDCCKQLQILKFENCSLGVLDLTPLSECRLLQVLEIIIKDAATYAKWLTLPASSSLTRLSVTSSEETSAAAAYWCDAYNKLPNLSDLTLDQGVAAVPMFHALYVFSSCVFLISILGSCSQL